MGFLFKCDVCSPANFQTESLSEWLEHLLSKGHQSNANHRLDPRNQWKNDSESYVMTGIIKGLPCSEKELLEWITEHGILSEYVFNQKHKCIIFTLSQLGLVGGSSDARQVRWNFRKEWDARLKIKPKSKYSDADWSRLLNSSNSWRQRSNSRGQTTRNPMMMATEANAMNAGSSNEKKLPNDKPVPVLNHSIPSKKSKGKIQRGSQQPTATVSSQSSQDSNNAGKKGRSKNALVFTNKNRSSVPVNQRNSANDLGSASTSNLSGNSASTSECQSERSSRASFNSNNSNNNNTSSQKRKSNSKSSNVPNHFHPHVVPPPPPPQANSTRSSNMISASSSNAEMQGMSDPSLNQTDQVKKRRRSRPKNRKSKEGGGEELSKSTEQHVNESQNSVPPTVPTATRELGMLEQRGQKQRIVLPPTLTVQSTSQKVIPEPINFRGGFSVVGRNRLDSQRISESSDGPMPVTPTASDQGSNFQKSDNAAPTQQKKTMEKEMSQQPAPGPSTSSNHTSVLQPQVLPNQQQPVQQYKVLPRPQFEHRGKRAITPAMLQQQLNPNMQQPPHARQFPPNLAFRAPVPMGGNPQPLPLLPNHVNVVPVVAQYNLRGPATYLQPQHHPTVAQVVYQPPAPNVLVSPIFTSQLTPEIMRGLSNPFNPRSKNPYKFNEMPPFPCYFELFQKLPDENFKPSKHPLFIPFSKLRLTDQLEEFFKAQSLPPSEVLLRWQVILDILVILRDEFSRCELYAFGSILTGLGDFASDIDIYVDLHGESTAPVDPRVKMSSQQAVDRVKRIIRRSKCPHNKTPFVKNLIPVKSARVPILKLTHRATDINCDLSFENRLSVQNTRMLAFYLNLNPRIFRFMVLIRYWAKFHHVTGSNHIKNYALTLLVLVYLCKKGFVPPVVHLQHLKECERKHQGIKRNPDEIDGWDASFCTDVEMIKKSGFRAAPFPGDNPTSTLIQMAIEFFDMYANLDFSTVVVCPLLGDILPRKGFDPGNEEDLPDTLDRYKKWAMKQETNRRLNINCCFCVQDPFVLSFNVGCVTPLGTLLKFQIACTRTAQDLKKNNLKSFLDVLVPLPDHIGEKKFMKILKTEQKTDELRTEIKNVVGCPIEVNGPNKVKKNQSPPSKLPFVVPDHLKKFESLMDEKSMKAALKKGKWETFMDFYLSSEFESLFLTELYRCNISVVKLEVVMSRLWKEFALDYLNNLFGAALKLQVTDEKSNDVEVGNPQSGKKSRWKIRTLSKKEEDKIKPTKKSKTEVEMLHTKITDLEKPLAKSHINYKMWKLLVDYPFWINRPTLSVKVGKQIQESGSIIRIPVIPSSSRKDEKDKKRKKKGKENEEAQKSKEEKIQLKTCFDSIDFENRVSELIRESAAKVEGFIPFQIYALAKLDVSSTTEKPQLIFLFERDSAVKRIPPEYQRAMVVLSNLISDTFPAYQLYRLAEWLNAAVESDSPMPQIPSLPADEKGTAECAGTEKKKKRTKSEEDLLIPSSSSSSTSSTEPEVDELEGEEGEGEQSDFGEEREISDEELDDEAKDNDADNQTKDVGGEMKEQTVPVVAEARNNNNGLEEEGVKDKEAAEPVVDNTEGEGEGHDTVSEVLDSEVGKCAEKLDNAEGDGEGEATAPEVPDKKEEKCTEKVDNTEGAIGGKDTGSETLEKKE